MKNCALSFCILLFVVSGKDLYAFQNTDQDFAEYRGTVVDARNSHGIPSAQLSITNTNISTITNSEGEFLIKIPKGTQPAVVKVSYVGYESKKISLEYFSKNNTKIELEASVEELSEVNIYDAENPRKLVRKMLLNKGENYIDYDSNMRAFYRESIKKGRKNVSLSEAVIKIHKKAYTASGKDAVELVKARKTADYDKLDTLALKLRGGPYNALFIDMIKYPDFLFYEYDLENYEFEFEEPAQIDNRYLYVVRFEDKNKEMPWYYGKLYIDAETQTLIRAQFSLNVDNRRVATRMFVNKKPGNIKVYPLEVNYEIDYQQQNGKWLYGYGSAQLEFLVNWKRKLFNSRYHVHSEMAVTGWEEKITDENPQQSDAYIKTNVVMTDNISGFSDPDFWGSSNIIEPDKSIEEAIEKIRERLN